MDIIDDQIYINEDFSGSRLPGKEYFNCSFKECDLTESDLSHITFVECSFEDCNMKMTRLASTTLREVLFRSCNLMGVNFFECKRFMLSLSFDRCNLYLSSFNSLILKKTNFNESVLKETDFSGADLSEAKFIKCDLARTIFMNTKLLNADLSSSENYSIDPEINSLAGARFSLAGVSGLLDKYKIVIE